MFSRARIFCNFFHLKNLVKYESSDSAPKKIYSKRFFDREVQELLRKMTNVNMEKVFELKSQGKPQVIPKYKLLTTEELKIEMEKIQDTADYLLQIPPLVDIIDQEPEILETNPSLEAHDDDFSKIVFTDISFDVLDEERIVVVREPNGDLRTATRDEHFRMNQVYFPKPGRKLEMPEMFQEQYLKAVIDREDYIFILDRACAQFEPFDAAYHRVIEQTYEAINERSHFEKLHSTRHFGSLVFYLVTHKKIDNLLMYNISTNRIADACDLIKVYHLIHPDCGSAKITEEKSRIDFIKDFINLDSNKKDVLELTLQTYKSEGKNIGEIHQGFEKVQRVGGS